jgi:hypothetical protein
MWRIAPWEALNMQQLLEALDWVKEWQFLVGSMILLLAGAITVHAINRQVRRRALEIEDSRRRVVRSLRASLPDDLEVVCSYARQSANAARRAVKFINAKENGRQEQGAWRDDHSRRCPSVPPYVLANLKVLMENLDRTNAEQFADLVQCYHVQHVRLATAVNNLSQLRSDGVTVPKDINFNPVFKHTLELYMRAKDMLPFARGEAEEILVAFRTPEVLRALKELNIDPVISPEAREHCVRFLSRENIAVRS